MKVQPSKCKDRDGCEARVPCGCPEEARVVQRRGTGCEGFLENTLKTKAIRYFPCSSGKVPPSLISDYKKNFCIGQQLF